MDSNAYSERFDRLFDILRADPRLAENVTGGVTVKKGYPTLIPEPGCAVFVDFGGVASVENDTMHGLTGSSAMVTLHFRIWFQTQQPEAADTQYQVMHLAANTYRVLADHSHDALWNRARFGRGEVGVDGTGPMGFFSISQWNFMVAYKEVTP